MEHGDAIADKYKEMRRTVQYEGGWDLLQAQGLKLRDVPLMTASRCAAKAKKLTAVVRGLKINRCKRQALWPSLSWHSEVFDVFKSITSRYTCSCRA